MARNSPGEHRLTLTVPEAAVLLGISRGSAYEAARIGTLPVRRIGRRLVVPREALTTWLAGAGEPIEDPRAKTRP